MIAPPQRNVDTMYVQMYNSKAVLSSNFAVSSNSGKNEEKRNLYYIKREEVRRPLHL